MNSLFLICSFQAFFLSVLVFLKKKKSHSDYILGAWLFLITVHVLLEYSQSYNYDHNYPFPWLIGIDVSFSMLHPILVFIYILSYTRIAANRWKYLYHLLPFILINILLISPLYARPADEKINLYNAIMNGEGYGDSALKYYAYVIMAFGAGYLVSGLLYIRKHRMNLKQQLSTVKGFELRWLYLLLIIMGCVFLLAVILEVFTNTFQVVPPEWGTAIVFAVMAMGIFYIGIHGILQTDYFSGYDPRLISSGQTRLNLIEKRTGKLQDEELSDRRMESDYSRLIHFMTEEKPFLENDLNISKLAGMVDLKPHVLSMLINRMSNKNFFDFVNTYRVMEFKSQVKDPANRNYTLLSIAYSCGFNSKTTFNRAFRNITGQTPSEFYNSAHQDTIL